MPICEICERKAILRRHRLSTARQKAIKRAIDEEKITAIWEEGINYSYGDESEATGRIVEYVSKHSKVAAA